jgi:hypothetical protein
MRKIYPAYLIKDLLQNFTGVDNGLPSLVKFNPEHHKLDILLSNQCLFPSMPEDVKNKLPDLEAILKKMSDSKDLKEKQDLAKKILLMIKPYGLGRNNEDNYLFFTSVVGQLRYFLHGRLSEPNLN